MFRVKPSLLAGGMLLALLLAIGFPSEVSAEKSLGHMYECGHAVRGEVFVKNDREVIIRGFNYDWGGPDAWFHGQLKGAKGIYLSDKNYVTLPFPGDKCAKLEKKDMDMTKDISLILPRSIKEFATIGIFCYEYCHNFGHIVINPEDLSNVADAPAGLQEVKECNEQTDQLYQAKIPECPLDKTDHNKLNPKTCNAGSAPGKGQGSSASKGNNTESAGSKLLPNVVGLIAGGILAILQHL